MPGERFENRIVEAKSVVKWFDPRKGFGFIIGPAGEDVFFHYTTIEKDGFRAMKDGEPVVYSAEKSERGWCATAVVPLD